MVIDKINFPIYGAIIILSLIMGLSYVFICLRKEGYKDKNIFLYSLMFISFSIVFAKIFSMLANGNTKNVMTAGLSSYGGALGVVLAAFIFEKILPTGNKLFKYTIISLMLMYGISKIACFFSGCCYGLPYNGIFSVTYTNGLNIPLFPIQIVETITFLSLFIICHKLRNKENIEYITVLSGAILKFSLDFLRYEHLTKIFTINQVFSILLFISTIILYIYHKKKLSK